MSEPIRFDHERVGGHLQPAPLVLQLPNFGGFPWCIPARRLLALFQRQTVADIALTRIGDKHFVATRRRRG